MCLGAIANSRLMSRLPLQEMTLDEYEAMMAEKQPKKETAKPKVLYLSHQPTIIITRQQWPCSNVTHNCCALSQFIV